MPRAFKTIAPDREAHPGLPIERSPDPERGRRSKGFFCDALRGQHLFAAYPVARYATTGYCLKPLFDIALAEESSAQDPIMEGSLARSTTSFLTAIVKPGLHRNARRNRSGTVALAFVLVLMLVIGASMLAVARREVDERTMHHHQRWNAMLENALEARWALRARGDGGKTIVDPLVLPVEQESEIRITPLDSGMDSATLYRNDTPLYSILRPRKL